MGALWKALGCVAFYVTYPLLALYLNKDARTRLIVTCERRVLLVKPLLSNGKWDLPGGGLHAGEDPASGVVRELREELGISLRPGEVRFVREEVFTSGLLRYNVHYFSASLPVLPKLALQKWEIAEAEWYTVEQVGRLKLDRRLREIITDALRSEMVVV